MVNKSRNEVVCEASKTWLPEHDLQSKKQLRPREVKRPKLLSVAMMVTQVSNLHCKSSEAGIMLIFWH